jgi:hypothetical protein
MEIKLVMDDEAVDAFAVALAKAMRPVEDKPAKAAKGKGKAKAAEAEAEADTGDEGEADTGETDTGETDTGAEDFGEDTDTKKPEASRDDVLAALKTVSSKIDQDTAMDILKSVGKASKLSALAEGKFAAVIKACNDATAKKK